MDDSTCASEPPAPVLAESFIQKKQMRSTIQASRVKMQHSGAAQNSKDSRKTSNFTDLGLGYCGLGPEKKNARAHAFGVWVQGKGPEVVRRKKCNV